MSKNNLKLNYKLTESRALPFWMSHTLITRSVLPVTRWLEFKKDTPDTTS
jgi:hypothetical protein